MLRNAFGLFFQVLKYPLYACLAVVSVWLVIVLTDFLLYYLDGYRLKRGRHNPPGKVGLFRQLFFDAPRAYVRDVYDTDPDYFKYKGLVIYTGAQGDGKTISMIRDIMSMQQEYPLCKCMTNLGYAHEDEALSDWHQLVDYKNGIYGVIVGMDEIQNWFSSKQSKDFPPEMFEVVTQNRKNRRIIMATTQNFYQAAKDIRAQCSEVRKCRTFWGCFTVVHAVKPVMDANGDVRQWKHVRFYSFVHSREIRESYDTYRVIESLVKSGFRERPLSGDTSVYVIGGDGRKKVKK